MRFLLMICFFAAAFVSLNAAVVNNSEQTVSSEDSLSVIFYSLDSIGNPSAADSVYLLVIGPSGNVTAGDSLAISDQRITSTSVGSRPCYSFAEQVSNLDGSGSPGCYSLTLLALNSNQALLTPNQSSFQLVSTELSDQLAAIGDSSALGRWVWDVPQSTHDIPGSFGGYLDADISGISAGGGAYSVTICVFDTTTALTLPGVSITVRNLDQSALLASGRTDVSGRASFNLDAASYLVAATAPGYIFQTYDTVVVNGPVLDTVVACQFQPEAPELVAFCRVWGYLFTADGSPEAGATVAARIPTGVTNYGWVMISPISVTATADSNGYFALDLLPSDSLGADGADYEFTITRDDGTIFRRRLSVPDSTTWRFTW